MFGSAKASSRRRSLWHRHIIHLNDTRFRDQSYHSMFKQLFVISVDPTSYAAQSQLAVSPSLIRKRSTMACWNSSSSWAYTYVNRCSFTNSRQSNSRTYYITHEGKKPQIALRNFKEHQLARESDFPTEPSFATIFSARKWSEAGPFL